MSVGAVEGSRWRWFSLAMLGSGLSNLVGFLVYGYGRHYSFD